MKKNLRLRPRSEDLTEIPERKIELFIFEDFELMILILFIFLNLFINCTFAKFLEEKEVICTSDKVIINLSFNEGFNGIVFAEKKYNEKECRWMGNGSKYLLVVIPLENATTTAALGLPVDNGICGISYDPNNAEHVLSLVISPDPVILTEEAFALRVKCIHSSADILLTLTAPSMDPIKLT